MLSFDPGRPIFKPYGFTCELWSPLPMARADRHNEIEVNLLKSGSLTYLIGGNSVTIPAGRLAVFWAAIPHQIVASNANTEYYVATIPLAWFIQRQFPKHLVDAVLRARIVLDAQAQNRWTDWEMFGRWVGDLRSADPQQRRVAFLEIESRLLRFAEGMSCTMSETNDARSSRLIIETDGLHRVERMAIFIAQNYAEKITVDQISAAAGLHPNYAMALFKKALGITVIDCVTQHRISHAQLLLATTNRKIADVAVSSGFPSLSRFYRAFYQFCGYSPKAYRLSQQWAEPPDRARRDTNTCTRGEVADLFVALADAPCC